MILPYFGPGFMKICMLIYPYVLWECNGVNVAVTPGGHFLWLQGPKVSCHKHSKLSGTNQSLLSAIDFYVFMFFNLSGYL
jgi:hypothetical protein